MDSARPFRAFVSYCHADAAFAARLQRRLEGYRLPRRLADRVTPLPGQASGRIGPIFRDRADLSAAEDLSAAVREAIAASSALVVVASPDAAGSRWVALEIRLFRELHPGAPVLVALARGEPEAALPEALRIEGIEPLAADFRREGDGKRLAFLKIVAGLTGIPFDALVQRDAQRQLRRVMVVTLGAGVMALVMAALLVMALQARSEAERRRAGAEGLVRFMLTTQRPRLREVGRLSIMQETNERALRYFDEQGEPQRLSDPSVELRALVLHALGEVEAITGDKGKARARFREAYVATLGVLKRRPNDPDAIFAHAQSAFWIGDAALDSGEYDKARTAWDEYLREAQLLRRIEGRTRRALLELGYANGNLCHLKLRNRADVAGELLHCRASVGFVRAALAAPRADGEPTDPEIRTVLANRLAWLADALNESRMFDEAVRGRLEERRLLEAALERNPEDANLLDRAVASVIGMGKIAVARGEPRDGIKLFRESIVELDRLRASFPDNMVIFRERFRATLLLADASLKAGDGQARGPCDAAGKLLAEDAARHREGSVPDNLRTYFSKICPGVQGFHQRGG